ncbi:S41 family peptidase [Algoriphagus sediminis]|uniref:S41 family peptidase n=1 Tax=Algoriphagus sediminis TaxID=3057113 RepID=A0ABT7YA13_9BACT|nr:S41 family peptidase [Algoriphagus sediminis]MDN3203350.1 S41 family peptidase [Algoriphagus sediminis]
MKSIFIAFLLFFCVSAFGQDLTKEQVMEDLIQLKEAIEEFNPALEAYNPDFQSSTDSLFSTISTPTYSAFEAFDLVSQLCAFSNEGHFSLGNWEDPVHSGFIENKFEYIPLSVKIADEKLWVWLDLSKEQKLIRGHEILSINGMRSSDILRKIYLNTPTDGDIRTYAQRTIENNFSWMYYLYVDRENRFEIETKSGSGEIQKTRIQALTREKHFENYAEYYPNRARAQEMEETDAFYSLEFEGLTSFLTIPSFDRARVEENDINSKRLYKTIFEELKQNEIQNLIIDLRGNTGGLNEFADDIVPFIQKKPSDSPLLKRTISWEGKIRNYRFPKASNLAFTGSIIVLVDGRTYSAGNTIARYLKEYGDAIFIGEETGTRYEGFAAGSKQYVTLKNTQFRIGIPRYHITFDPSKKQLTSNRGLLPDYEIEPNIQDLLEEKDLHMEKAKILISQN